MIATEAPEIVTGNLLTEAEKEFIYYQTGRSGSGMTALFKAIFAMDMPNREKLAKGFPDEVEVANNYNFTPGYWEDLQKRWTLETGYEIY